MLFPGERGEQIHYLRFPGAGSGSLGLRQALEEQEFELYAPGLHHVAFAVETRADVDAAHAAAVAAGAEVLHAPRLFPQYRPDFYATFFLDPDGFRIEVAASRDARCEVDAGPAGRFNSCGTGVPHRGHDPDPNRNAVDRPGGSAARPRRRVRRAAVRRRARGALRAAEEHDVAGSSAALERQGLVQRIEDRGRLRPGPVLLRYANRDTAATLVELAAPSLRRLADASGETINLAVPGPDGVEHLAQEDTAHFVGVTDWVGRRVAFELAANGKCFLAFGGAKKLTPELRRVRARGYATSIDELELGLSALAAPVFGPGGDAIAALSISGPSARLTSDRIAQLAPLLVEEAATLAERLGHRDHARGAA